MRWGLWLILASCGVDLRPARPEQIILDLSLVPPMDRLRDPVRLPDPSQFGPHPVGVRTIEMTDASRSRTMQVEVWYPASNASGNTKTYELESRLGVTLATLDGDAIEDAPITSGTFPMVLFSHGFGGIRFQSFFLTEHLASHGYVVVAPDHPGNTLADFADLGSEDAALQSSIDRPLDMLFARDQILADPSFSIDPARVAMSGHSFGGWTTFEVGLRDPNIAAFVPFAPGFRNGAMPSMAAGLGRPLLIFGGSEDTTCEYDANQVPAYDAALPPKGLVRIDGAGHLDFSNLCDIALARLFVDDGCDPALIDPASVQQITKTLTTAFLGRHLKNQRYDVGAYASGPVAYQHSE
jgi:predicted dienelactone hydrolase